MGALIFCDGYFDSCDINIVKLISSKLTGTPDVSGWAQIHDFLPDEQAKLEKKGHFFAVISTQKASEGIDTISLGREILARLHEEYFASTEESAFEALKISVNKVFQEFSEETSIQIGAAVFRENNLYISVAGGVKAFLLREGVFAKLADETISVAGVVKEGDMLLLGTKRFFEATPIGVIKGMLESGSPEVAIQNLAPVVHGGSNNGSYGVVIVAAGEKQKPKVEEHTVVETGMWRRKVAGFLDKLISFFPERRLYVKADTKELGEEKKRNVAVIVGMLLLLLLVISILFGIRQSKIKQVRSKYEGRLKEAQHNLEEARSLVFLDQDRARQLIFSAKEIAYELKDEGVKDGELDALINDINQSMGDIGGIYQNPAELFLDLSLLTSGFNGSSLAASDGQMVVLDRDGQRVVSINIGTKKTETLAGPELLQKATEIGAYTDRVFVADEGGISEILESNVKRIINKDWEGDIKFASYTGNIYVLDKDKGLIYRYQGGETFGTKENWFGAGINPDLSDTTSIAIDGSIWVLQSGGRILKFSQGSPEAFNITGVDGSLSDAATIYTDQDSDFLYILDKSGRVVVVDKKGNYKAQYTDEKIKEATSLVVSEKDKKIILLVGPKLYSIELKNL